MRVLISGSCNFGDTAFLDILLDGLEDALLPDDKEVIVIAGHRKGAEHCVQMITEARHSKCRVWSFGKNERFKRSQMITKGRPQMAYFLQDEAAPAPKEYNNMQRLLLRCLRAKIPTYIMTGLTR